MIRKTIFLMTMLIIIGCSNYPSDSILTSTELNKTNAIIVDREISNQSNKTLIEEANHLHYSFEPLDISFLYPSSWQTVQEKDRLVFYPLPFSQQTKKMFLHTQLLPISNLDSLIESIAGEGSIEITSTYPHIFKKKVNDFITVYHIHEVPKKGLLYMSFYYHEEDEIEMNNISEQVLDSLIYNYSIIQSQLKKLNN